MQERGPHTPSSVLPTAAQVSPIIVVTTSVYSLVTARESLRQGLGHTDTFRVSGPHGSVGRSREEERPPCNTRGPESEAGRRQAGVKAKETSGSV